MPDSANEVLMKKIFSTMRAPLKAAAATTIVPEEFLAALVAGESGGNPAAQRFEPDVFKLLCMVLIGKKSAYSPAGIHHPLGPNDILPYVDPGQIDPRGPAIPGKFAGQLARVAQLATSHGWTQIMGWHALEFSWPMSRITDPAAHLDTAVQLLTYFGNHYDLDVSAEFAGMFTCWNTGRPDGKTYDPDYVPNGIERMKIYAALMKTNP